MDYKRIYTDLISYRQSCSPPLTSYYEVHHIQPQSLGGTNSSENLAKLTAREHFIAHLLLARFNPCRQTAFALMCMQMQPTVNSNRPRIKHSKLYEWARTESAKHMSTVQKLLTQGENNSQYHTKWVVNLATKHNMKIDKETPIPIGYSLGRFVNSTPLKCKCARCNIEFLPKKKRKYCSKECSKIAKPNLVLLHFEKLKEEYLKCGIISKAFLNCGIAYNGNLFSQFRKLLAKVPERSIGLVL